MPSLSVRLKRQGPELAYHGHPCQVCVRIERLKALLMKANRHRKGRLLDALNKAERTHPRCGYCGLFFGDYHLGHPTKDIEGIPACQFCYRDYRKGLFRGVVRLRYHEKGE